MQPQAFLSRFPAVLIAGLLLTAPAVNGSPEYTSAITCFESNVNKEFPKSDMDAMIRELRNGSAKGFLLTGNPREGMVTGQIADPLTLLPPGPDGSVVAQAFSQFGTRLDVTNRYVKDTDVTISFEEIARNLELMKELCCYPDYPTCRTMVSYGRSNVTGIPIELRVETFAATSQELAAIHAMSTQEQGPDPLAET